MNPSITVIIPTYNRPHYLPKAVTSALAGMAAGSVEVIVVPNGSDETWKMSLGPYIDHPDIIIEEVKEANANIARNLGLSKSRGEFVRFLDDDDYLLPEIAVKQYQIIRSSGADVVSGSVMVVNENGQQVEILNQPDTNDMCVAFLGPKRMCQPTAHIFRRSAIENVRWNTKTEVHQDCEFFFELCMSRELIWIKTNEIVGGYVRHQGPRTSTATQYRHLHNKILVPPLKRAHETLLKEERSNDTRRLAIANGLWSCIHGTFYLEPFYWSHVARLAQDINPNAIPEQPIYSYPILRKANPLIIQWLLLPKRWIYYHFQLIKHRKLFRRHCLPKFSGQDSNKI